MYMYALHAAYDAYVPTYNILHTRIHITSW